jgi:hypothetical protein
MRTSDTLEWVGHFVQALQAVSKNARRGMKKVIETISKDNAVSQIPYPSRRLSMHPHAHSIGQ